MRDGSRVFAITEQLNIPVENRSHTHKDLEFCSAVFSSWRVIPGLGYVVNNHGDRCCPLRIGLWDPLQMAVSWLINGGDPNYLLTGMILQVVGG